MSSFHIGMIHIVGIIIIIYPAHISSPGSVGSGQYRKTTTCYTACYTCEIESTAEVCLVLIQNFNGVCYLCKANSLNLCQWQNGSMHLEIGSLCQYQLSTEGFEVKGHCRALPRDTWYNSIYKNCIQFQVLLV